MKIKGLPQRKYNRVLIAACCADAGIVAPEHEHRFSDLRRFAFDLSWPGVFIALEIEGGIWTGGAHARPKGILRDMLKYNLAATIGWRVLRVAPEHLYKRDTWQMVRTAIETPIASDLTNLSAYIKKI